MSKSSINVIGNGFVGGSLTTGMSHVFNVNVYDKLGKLAAGGKAFSSLKEMLKVSELEIGHTFINFVCCPTPMFENGECDTRIVESVLKELAEVSGDRIAVIKSTVPPGSTERWNKMFNSQGLNIVFNPEFLREASALEDFKNQDRIILGGPKKAVNKVRDMYQTAFPNTQIVKTSSINAEMNKYVINNFLATKVSFANEIYQICEKLKEVGHDIDYDRIIEIASLDKRLGTSHWKVPGPMPSDDEQHELRKGYSGSCFCKDINAMIYIAKSLGVDPKILEAGWNKNLEVRPERDWEHLMGRAVSKRKE